MRRQFKGALSTTIQDNQFGTEIFAMDNYVVSHHDDALFLSTDWGDTFPNRLFIPYIPIIRYIHVFHDGKVIFADHTKIYYSHDWITFQESAVLNIDGTPFTPAIDWDNFTSSKIPAVRKILNGKELTVWGNYSTEPSVQYTDAVKVWYTSDYGLTVKTCYVCNSTGFVSCRHIHCVDFNHVDNTFWLQTGDSSNESHWVKGVYDDINDLWTWTTMATGAPFKTTNMIFHDDGYVYFSHDTTPGGAKRVLYETLTNSETHELLFETNKDCIYIAMGETGDLLVIQTRYGGTERPRIMYYSPDRVNFYPITGEMPPGAAYDDYFNSQYYAICPPNSRGKILTGICGNATHTPYRDWGRKPSAYLDNFIRKAGFPDAFKTIETPITNGLIANFDATKIKYLQNDELVSFWDGLVFTCNAVQISDAKKPIYKINQLNNLPVVYFNGDAYLDICPKTLEMLKNISGLTVFVIKKTVQLSAQVVVSFSFATGIFGQDAINEKKISWGGRRYKGDSYSTLRGQTIYSDYVLQTSIVDNIQAVVEVRGNGVVENSGAFSTSGIVSDSITKGTIGQQAQGTKFSFDGYIAEILVYNRTLTINEVSTVESYLMQKWGLP